MRERFGVTSVVITHDMVSAFDIADRIAMLIKGRVVALGSPAEVLAVDNADVQGFISSSGVDVKRFEHRGNRKTAAELAARARERKAGRAE